MFRISLDKKLIVEVVKNPFSADYLIYRTNERNLKASDKIFVMM